MKTYKVLWLDDQHEKFESFKLIAEQEGIYLDGVTSFEAGRDCLSANPDTYCAVLLDAMFFEKRDDSRAEADTLNALSLAKDWLASLPANRKLPSFILSGQRTLERNSTFEQVFGAHFIKTDRASEQALFTAIKAKADKLKHFQLQYQYKDVFAACTAIGVSTSTTSAILEILEYLAEPDNTKNFDFYLNPLRQIVEEFLFALHRNGLLTNQCCTSTKVNLTNSHLFLAGEKVSLAPPTSIQTSASILPKVLADSLGTLIVVTSNGSHYQQDSSISQSQREAARQLLQGLRKQVQTPYLLASLTYQVFDLLVWLQQTLADFTTFTQLQAICNSAIQMPPLLAGILTPGKVNIIKDKGVGFFTIDGRKSIGFIPPGLIKQHSLQNDEQIRVQLGPVPTDPTKLPTVISIVKGH